MMTGCNNVKTKLIIETNNIAEKTKETIETKESKEPKKANKLFVNKNNLKAKILKRTNPLRSKKPARVKRAATKIISRIKKRK